MKNAVSNVCAGLMDHGLCTAHEAGQRPSHAALVSGVSSPNAVPCAAHKNAAMRLLLYFCYLKPYPLHHCYPTTLSTRRFTSVFASQLPGAHEPPLPSLRQGLKQEQHTRHVAGLCDMAVCVSHTSGTCGENHVRGERAQRGSVEAT